jgi:DNA-binding response OmpR family regulator
MKEKIILIIDDDEKVLEEIKDLLGTDSYVVHTARRNGATGILD